MTNNLTELARLYNMIPKTVSETIMNASGLLRTMNFDMAVAGDKDIYSQYNSLPTATLSIPGAGMTGQSVLAENKEISLAYAYILHEELKSIVEMSAIAGMTVESYFSSKAPLFYEALAQKFAALAFYGSLNDTESPFLGLKQIATANSQTITASGGSGSSTSIYAVRWKPGMCTGLYNPTVMAGGELVKQDWINNGSSYMISESNTRYEYYGVKHTLNLGLKVTSKDLVATYENLDSSHLPTSDNMDALLDLVKSDPTNTILYMNRTARRYLMKLKNSKLEVGNVDNGINNKVLFWNEIPIIIDDNITDTEV
jgi:hypothetical protein